ncbi:hypothetical protein GOP47_0007866 [Adiantum capillus-veneris]|uniref:Uncharacterized protein n=1 Tax=Adiantum capillus-veneris TaxID=13818 RepID=A0A9D4V322_ADICA|nr:hypothetical protein GOP47_0007866 [Adiantum capillus-veneris]
MKGDGATAAHCSLHGWRRHLDGGGSASPEERRQGLLWREGRHCMQERGQLQERGQFARGATNSEVAIGQRGGEVSAAGLRRLAVAVRRWRGLGSCLQLLRRGEWHVSLDSPVRVAKDEGVCLLYRKTTTAGEAQP